MMQAMKIPQQIPSEEAEQAALMRWAMYETGKWPALNLLYHIPNGGLRSKATAGKMKATGQKKACRICTCLCPWANTTAYTSS